MDETTHAGHHVRLPHGRDIGVGDDKNVRTEDADDGAVAERSSAFRGFLIWLTVPPMGLPFFDQPSA